MAITRDLRFGTPEWTLDADWVWGSEPLVRQNPADPDCATNGWCSYRTAPDSLAEVEIGLTANPRGGSTSSREPGATVRLPSGTTLRYEPVIYDGTSYPAAPAGAQTSVLAFRLAEVLDRNGYRTCYRYQQANDPVRGRVAMLTEIAYGPTALAPSCTAVTSSSTRHRIEFVYDQLTYDSVTRAGYFSSWSVRYGAPVSTTQLLGQIVVYALGREERRYHLVHEDGGVGSSHRPLLVAITEEAADARGRSHGRTVRTFAYGSLGTAYDAARVIDLGPLGSAPPSIAGNVTRPMKRWNPYDNPFFPIDNPFALFQSGGDVMNEVAPPSSATSEEWSFGDANADGLPDIRWSRERGIDPAAQPWVTFETLDPGARLADRPAQQAILINDGISGGRLGTTVTFLRGTAPDLSSTYAQSSNPLEPGSWYWGEGRGETRTGMPVVVSAPELPNPSSICPPAAGRDTRQWPVLPDGTRTGRRGSEFETLTTLTQPSTPVPFDAFDPILGILDDIYGAFRPTMSFSSTVSGWVDVDGDGVAEFVATPAWIERFRFDEGCKVEPDLLSLIEFDPGKGARALCPASADPLCTPDTAWRVAAVPIGATAGVTSTLMEIPAPGPAGPIGLPLAYDVSTSDTVSVGLTLPIGGIVSTGISAATSGPFWWAAFATAAPGHVTNALTPRTQFGGTLRAFGPSMAGIMQTAGNIAYNQAQGSGSDAGGIIGGVMSLVRMNFDLTLVTATTNSRSESRAQLLDVNSDGLLDYLLYASGDRIPGTRPGSLLAFLRTPSGSFAPPVAINAGQPFAYPALPTGSEITDPAILDRIDGRVAEVNQAVASLSSGLFGPPPHASCSGSPGGCVSYVPIIIAMLDDVDSIRSMAAPFMGLTTETIPREAALAEIGLMADALRTWWIATTTLAVTGTQVPGWNVIVETATRTSKALAERVEDLARTVRQLGYPSRVNVIGTGFSHLDGQGLTASASGYAFQTKGFVDLNGDSLPDYVSTSDRQSACVAGQWQVFWGSGTSSISAGRAFLPTPSCIAVPATPPDAPSGLATLPLSLDRVYRRPTNNPWLVDTLVHSYVGLNDYNRDGLPDIVIAGSATEPWGLSDETTSRTWNVFLNTGSSFDTSPSFRVASPAPSASLSGAVPASPLATALAVPYPAMQATHSVGTVVGSQSRTVAETSAGMLDIDGDGVPEVVRRVTYATGDPAEPMREGLLAWSRSSTGPAGTMIEERRPLEGSRHLIEYRPATSFQWPDGNPTGSAPEIGHRSLAGNGGFLVRSVTTERLMGRADQRTRIGYDYKEPFFDLATRTPTGFAIRTSMPLDPALGTEIGQSVATSRRSAQRPDGLPGVTNERRFVVSTGAPVAETLTTYGDSLPTATSGIGGLQAIFSAPTRTLTVEYPSDLDAGPVFDVGFDGRDPYRDRAGGLLPTRTLTTVLDPTAGTGGSVVLPPVTSDPIAYRSPHSSTTRLDEATIETWVRPLSSGRDQVVADLVGGYLLSLVTVGSESRWRLDLGSGGQVTSSEPVRMGRWQHVVATFDRGRARLFVNGRDAGATALSGSITGGATLAIGCPEPGGRPGRTCLEGEIGELRIYPRAWATPPTVTEMERDLQLTDPSRADFGQPLRVLSSHDLARDEDDVVAEYTYATSTATTPVRGLVASEANRVLLPDGTSGPYLGYSQHAYDGLPVGQASLGNETSSAVFDGPAEVAARPSLQALRVVTKLVYDQACPGLVSGRTDPGGFTTETQWDATCAFPVEVKNALGHISTTHYYGVHGLPASTPAGPYGRLDLDGGFGQVAESIDVNGAVRRATYDVWGRVVAEWAPLDRPDRPGTRYEYADATCDPGESCVDRSVGRLGSPSKTTTFTWDDHARRCESSTGAIVECSSTAAVRLADEDATGAYRVVHAFGDGQTHAQAPLGGKPAWSMTGLTDFDLLGRPVRAYRVQYLPSGCPPAGIWCPSDAQGNPLRNNVAASQTTYDERGRVIKVFGTTVPTCPADAAGNPVCTLPGGPQPPDVTTFRYPAPGMVETTDAKGVPTVVRQDSRGLTFAVEERLTAATAPYSELRTTYDRLGRATAVSDQNGNVVRHHYDALSRLTSDEDPDRGTTRYRYDTRSNLVEVDVASGERIVHTYDKLSRITQTDYLRPRVGPSVVVYGDGVEGEQWTPPELCHELPDVGPGLPGGLNLSCSGDHTRLELPLVGVADGHDRLELRYRLLANGGEPTGDRPGWLRVGYPDRTQLDGMAAAFGAAPTPQRPGTGGEYGSVTTLAFDLPSWRGQGESKLLLDFAGSSKGFNLDIETVTAQPIEWEIEERVLRTFDSSEPDYHVEHLPAGDVEVRPALDLTFDIPSANASGVIDDRSPSGRRLDCTGSVEDTQAVSGHGLTIHPGARCSVPLPIGGDLTTEFWMRPHRYPTQSETFWRAGGLEIVLTPDGSIACGNAFQPSGGAALPTDAWTHVALAHAGGTARCYVNGVQQPIGSPLLPGSIQEVELLGGTSGLAVDELRVVSNARSIADVAKDSLRPLVPGPPGGNLIDIDFAHPPVVTGPQRDQSAAGNDAVIELTRRCRPIGRGCRGEIAPGIQGMAFTTGDASRVRIPHSGTLQLADAVTAEVWVKRDSRFPRHHARLIGKWSGPGTPGWRLDFEPDSNRLRWEVVAEDTPPGGLPTQLRQAVFVTYEQLANDRWYHVAGTYDGHRTRVFIDGVPAHRWCSDAELAPSPVCAEPPPPERCAIELGGPLEGPFRRSLGDAVCVSGTIDNQEPVLIANDTQDHLLRGMVDEARISNYAKKEFEVAASARLASDFTQSLGVQTTMRNRLPVSDQIADQVARRHDSYDLAGRPVTTRSHIRGQRATDDFVQRSTSDSLGRRSLLQYPHGEVAVSEFALDGTENALVGYGPRLGQGSAQAAPYLMNSTFTITGKPATASYGNGVSTVRGYDDRRRIGGAFGPDRLENTEVASATGALLSDRDYTWDVVGDLETVYDPAQRLSARYTYDGLQRIKTSSVSSGTQTSVGSYDYDPLGNLLSKEGAVQEYGQANLAGGCSPTSFPLPHALTRRTDPTQGVRDPYCYDAAGRLLSSQRTTDNIIRRYTYFARGKVSHLEDSVWLSRFAYDGDGVRVWRSETGGAQPVGETVPFETYRELGPGCEVTYFVGATAIARRELALPGGSTACASSSGGLVWFTDDHLGGTTLLTDQVGAQVPFSTSHYLPFGSLLPISQYGATPQQAVLSGGRLFSSKRRDATGLYDFGARPYDPVTGRFTQPDDLRIGGSPQEANPYAYVRNGPLRLVDPTGHQATEAFIESPDMSNVSLPRGPFEYTYDPIAGTHGGPNAYFVESYVDPNAKGLFDLEFELGMARLDQLLGKDKLSPVMHAARTAQNMSDPNIPHLYAKLADVDPFLYRLQTSGWYSSLFEGAAIMAGGFIGEAAAVSRLSTAMRLDYQIYRGANLVKGGTIYSGAGGKMGHAEILFLKRYGHLLNAGDSLIFQGGNAICRWGACRSALNELALSRGVDVLYYGYTPNQSLTYFEAFVGHVRAPR